MKKSILFLSVMAIALVGCKSVSYHAQSAHTENLGKTVLIVPSLADLSVVPQHVTATLSGAEVEGLSLDKAKETVAAKALNGKADILVAPQYETNYLDGKLQTISVIGYAATIKSFRPFKVADKPFIKDECDEQDVVNAKPVRNTRTIADVKVAPKASLSLNESELVGVSEKKALQLAEDKLLRKSNADLLLELQHTVKIVDGVLKEFNITAYPATYVNYRGATKQEIATLHPTAKAEVYYNVIADVKAKGDKIQKTYPVSTFKTTKASELKELARIAVLKENDADVLLKEQYYFDYDAQGANIVSITICGTPAIYTNFRTITDKDCVDMNTEDNADGATQSTSLLGKILSIFKIKK